MLTVPKNPKILVAKVWNRAAAIQTRPVYRVFCGRKKGWAWGEAKDARGPQRPEPGPCSSIRGRCGREQIAAPAGATASLTTSFHL